MSGVEIVLELVPAETGKEKGIDDMLPIDNDSDRPYELDIGPTDADGPLDTGSVVCPAVVLRVDPTALKLVGIDGVVRWTLLLAGGIETEIDTGMEIVDTALGLNGNEGTALELRLDGIPLVAERLPAEDPLLAYTVDRSLAEVVASAALVLLLLSLAVTDPVVLILLPDPDDTALTLVLTLDGAAELVSALVVRTLVPPPLSENA